MESCEEGINILPDGRFYVSTVHSEEDVRETLVAIDRVCSRLAADTSSAQRSLQPVPDDSRGSIA
jgi:hypothetical protein